MTFHTSLTEQTLIDANEVEQLIKVHHERTDRLAFINQEKVIAAFHAEP